MPLFYFDVHEGDLFTEDEVGTELTGRDVVFAQARRLLIDIARDIFDKAEPLLLQVSVREGNGGPIHWHSLRMASRWVEGVAA